MELRFVEAQLARTIVKLPLLLTIIFVETAEKLLAVLLVLDVVLRFHSQRSTRRLRAWLGSRVLVLKGG